MRQNFIDRREAGRLLAAELVRSKLLDPVVVALPRGGVPVAVEVAQALHAPLDLVMVRKIGAPWQPEFAVAAVVDGARPEIVTNEEAVRATGVSRKYIEERAEEELGEIERRRAKYLRGRAQQPLSGRTVVLVDDGIATGTTVRAALKALRRAQPGRLILAVPVAPPHTVRELREQVDELVCLLEPPGFDAVGAFYQVFDQVGDDEVVRLMDAQAAVVPQAGSRADESAP